MAAVNVEYVLNEGRQRTSKKWMQHIANSSGIFCADRLDMFFRLYLHLPQLKIGRAHLFSYLCRHQNGINSSRQMAQKMLLRRSNTPQFLPNLGDFDANTIDMTSPWPCPWFYLC